MRRIIAGLTLSILLTITNIVESSSDSTDDNAFFLASGDQLPDEPVDSFTDLPDDPANSFTEVPDDSLNLSTDVPIASAQDNCQSSGNIDNLFLSSGIARVRPRGTACLNPPPPLPPYTDIYDSNGILNQLSPPTLPKIPDITIPGSPQEENKLRLEEQFNLPSFSPTTNTAGQEQDDICPKELVGDSQIPVCSLGKSGRDILRLPGEDSYTVFNVRPCMSQNCIA